MSRFRYVRNDTGPQIRVTLTEEDTGLPVDLTGGSVTLHFRAAGSEDLLFSRPLFIDPSNATDGIAILQWGVNDLNQPAGAYEGELEVIRSSGLRETLFDRLRFRIREDFD